MATEKTEIQCCREHVPEGSQDEEGGQTGEPAPGHLPKDKGEKSRAWLVEEKLLWGFISAQSRG